nr:hypothetical protein [Pseudomonas syringae pv. actinidiae]
MRGRSGAEKRPAGSSTERGSIPSVAALYALLLFEPLLG